MRREDWDARYSGEALVWRAEPNRFLVEETASLPPGRALDLGAGEGRNAVWLAERGWAVTAVDFSDVGLRKARALAETRGVAVEWVLADLSAYRPDPGAFDLAIVMYLHLPAKARRLVLGHAAGALAPGGVLLVVGHDLANIEEGHGGPQNPEVLFTAEDLVDDLAATGLVVERAERVTRRVEETERGPADALDALVRARRAG